jgi:hypothetical protein
LRVGPQRREAIEALLTAMDGGWFDLDLDAVDRRLALPALRRARQAL